MNFQDLGSIGELISALAVVVTLVYLSYQLRQNTRALTSNALQNRVLAQLSEAESIYNSKYLPSIFEKLGAGEDISESERIRFGTWLRAYHRLHEITVLQHEQGVLPDWMLDEPRHSMKLLFVRNALAQEIWELQKMAAAPLYREFVEKVLLEASKETDS